MSNRINIEIDGRNCVGLDVGDRYSVFHVEDAMGRELQRGKVRTVLQGIAKVFGKMESCRIALEVGSHSPWIFELLTTLGHEVTVANAHRVSLVSRNQRKEDGTDAKFLCWLLRANPALLFPIRHRGPEARADLSRTRSRHALKRARTLLINHVRGVVKQFGARIPSGIGADAFAHRAKEHLPVEAREVLLDVLQTIALLTAKVRRQDREIARRCRERYPETQRLTQVCGVGMLTALTFVLTIEDPSRFARRRDIGAYVGLVPRLRASGGVDPELSITKTGDRQLRWLLVQCAQYILSRRGKDSDLRRWGLSLAARGKKNAKKRAVVAVARKLSVLLLSLWQTGEEYVAVREATMAA